MLKKYVYVWVIADAVMKRFADYIKIEYDEEGEVAPSQFMKDACILFYDADGEEFVGNKKAESVDHAFDNHSFIGTFKEKLLAQLVKSGIQSVTTQFLLYDSEGRIKFAEGYDLNSMYVGRFEYRTE